MGDRRTSEPPEHSGSWLLVAPTGDRAFLYFDSSRKRGEEYCHNFDSNIQNDTSSLGARRFHCCTCGQMPSSHALTQTKMCRTCANVRQMHLVRRLFGENGSTPLVSNLTGAKCS